MKMGSLSGADKHNERKIENYSNKDIDQTRTKDNYHLIKPQKKGYKAEFDRIREEENLKGNLRLTGEKQSNVACEFLITSDNEFFKSIGEERTKQFFTDSLDFVKNKVGEKHIISAVVHLDETTPHMHITYIPVVEKANKKEIVNKRINCSEFWKGYNSYGILQDDFHKHCIEKGYNLERGEIGSRAEHLEVAEYKEKTTMDRVKQAQSKVDVLENEIKATESRLEDLKGIEQPISHINALSPQKSLTGAIKGISLEDIENLKITAVKGAEWKDKAIEAMKAFKGLKEKYDTLIEENKKRPTNLELYQAKAETMKAQGEILKANEKMEKLTNRVNKVLEQLPPDTTRQFQEKWQKQMQIEKAMQSKGKTR